MMVADIVFYFLAAILLVSAIRVITAKNPVHSVLFLVLAFFTAAGLFILIEAEFLAAILVMVYMGAVAILFLFVVMMLDIDFSELREGAKEHIIPGIAIGGVIMVELIAVTSSFHLDGHGEEAVPATETVNNTLELGKVLYTKYLMPFEVASLILLVALIGAVALTHRVRKGVKRQNIDDQLARTREQAVEMKQVKSGEGA
uniref:NADH-quinone oxidoreductase subunit J n=1 Tax=Magnetococcus massalia (strain MO-1) TaxID=451514 RepID=A0A1S7LN03_MAGMO|nr:NADH-quinone oxidoreductase chain J (NADH dehydrogenase I, chain J) (NDH-1, chain J) [Candidatus Magnetococcus massalia]